MVSSADRIALFRRHQIPDDASEDQLRIAIAHFGLSLREGPEDPVVSATRRKVQAIGRQDQVLYESIGANDNEALSQLLVKILLDRP